MLGDPRGDLFNLVVGQLLLTHTFFLMFLRCVNEPRGNSFKLTWVRLALDKLAQPSLGLSGGIPVRCVRGWWGLCPAGSSWA